MFINLFLTLSTVFALQSKFDKNSVISKVSSVLENLAGLETHSKDLYKSSSSYCDSLSASTKSSVSQINLLVSDLSYTLDSIITPTLMQQRYRKMDLEQKMSLNRNDRKSLQEEAENESKHNEKIQTWIASTIKLAEKLENSAKTSALMNSLTQLQKSYETSSLNKEVDAKLEELFVEFRNEYSKSSPTIIGLESQTQEIHEKLKELNTKVEKYQDQNNLLSAWCKVAKSRVDSESKEREKQVYAISIFHQILVDMNGELADYVLDRVKNGFKAVENVI